MKKFWKNFCIGAMAITSVMGFGGCGKKQNDVSVDLDNDGQISDWETLFEQSPSSDRLTIASVVEVKSLSDLKAINDSTETKVYKLVNDIDCGGQTLSINLGQSSLYGNNKVIKNFKLGNAAIFAEGEGGENINAQSLFYNGNAIYDLRLFMGHQTYSIEDGSTEYTISPFINVPALDNVIVKGKITVSKKYNNVSSHLSLLAATIESKRCDLSITNCQVIGDVDYSEVDSYATLYIGGIAPKLWEGDIVYNSTVTSRLKVMGTDMNIGLVAGSNDGFVSTVKTGGVIDTSYCALGDSYVGGIVGANGKNAEIKNATTNASINYKSEDTLSGTKEFVVGGIAGLNNGVISYSISDAVIEVTKCDADTYIGSVAGRGEHAIYYNVIGRGSIKPTNCLRLFVADLVGYSKYGYFEKIIVDTKIKINNTVNSSNVNLGLVTIFENLGSGFNSEAKYNAEFTPNFKGILIAGSADVYTNTAASSGSFKYNLGLRNEYEYYVVDENGERVPVPGIDNNPESDENDEPEYVTATLTPYVYKNLYILDTYTLNKYRLEDGENILESGLKFTYAKDPQSMSPMVATSSPSVVFQLNFFLQRLGFNYIIGDNEIDISSFDVSKFRFTLSRDKHLERYFRYNQKDYNGDLSPFDREFEKTCTYDLDDEMFSYLNKLITSDKSSAYASLLISKEFATSTQISQLPGQDYEEDEELEGDEGGEDEIIIQDSYTIEDRFLENLAAILKLMNINIDDAKYRLTADYKIISQDSEEVQTTRYIRFNFSDDHYNYNFTIDVNEMVQDIDRAQSAYVVYLDYHKDAKS